MFKSWKTRTRNKIVICYLLFIAVCDIFILIGWYQGKSESAAIFNALNGSGGLLGGLNAMSIAIENLFTKKGEGKNENP